MLNQKSVKTTTMRIYSFKKKQCVFIINAEICSSVLLSCVPSGIPHVVRFVFGHIEKLQGLLCFHGGLAIPRDRFLVHHPFIVLLGLFRNNKCPSIVLGIHLHTKMRKQKKYLIIFVVF